MPTDVLVPPLGTNVETLVLAHWYQREGETVTQGEPLFAVETDKATLDVEAPVSGVLQRVSAEAGAEVATLARIALILAPGEVLDDEGTDEAEEAALPSSLLTASGVGEVLQPRSGPSHGRIFISPRARLLAATSGLDWRALSGSGPEGAIVERDVRAALR